MTVVSFSIRAFFVPIENICITYIFHMLRERVSRSDGWIQLYCINKMSFFKKNHAYSMQLSSCRIGIYHLTKLDEF